MNRWTQGILFGGFIAAVVSVIWKLVATKEINTRRNTLSKIINYFANVFINLFGKLGLFKWVGRSKLLTNMILSR